MSSYDATTKTFSGEKLPRIYDADVSLGQVLLYDCWKYSDRIVQICIDDDVKLTCGQMSDLMRRVAVRLQKLNLKFGDVVGFVARNSTYLAPAVLGCFLIGLPVSSLFESFEVKDIIKVYKKTNPKIVFCDSDQIEKIETVLTTLNIEARIVTLDRRFKEFDYIKDYFDDAADFDSIPESFGMSSDKVCAAIVTSSGSTGQPKLTRISHAQILQSLYAFNGLVDNCVMLSNRPLSWVCGILLMAQQILNQHTRILSNHKLTSREYIDCIKKYKPNQLGLTPYEIIEMCEYLESNPTDLSCIKMISTGGWSISEEKIKQMESFMPNGKICLIYGMTETGGAVTRTDSTGAALTSVGKLLPNIQARILLENGEYGKIGETGELLIKMPFNFLGYLGDDEQAKAFLDDEGWIHTSDICYFDEKLNLYYIGRKNFLIRCLYNTVHPTEIEEIIQELPGVSKVCVVAMHDYDNDSLPCAVVERFPLSNITEKEIFEAVSVLEDYKHLRGGVFFVEKLQVTATGKLDRISIEKSAIALAKMG